MFIRWIISRYIIHLNNLRTTAHENHEHAASGVIKKIKKRISIVSQSFRIQLEV